MYIELYHKYIYINIGFYLSLKLSLSHSLSLIPPSQISWLPSSPWGNTRNNNFIMSCVALVKWNSTCPSLPFSLPPLVPLSISLLSSSTNPFKLRLARVSRAKSVAAKSTKGVKIKQATLQDYKLWHADAIKQMSLRCSSKRGEERGEGGSSH